MGIYIPNMEMPTQCGNCPISTNTRRCTILWREFGDPSKRLEDCPLLPLPEGHGRLIDADALDRAFTDLRFNSDGTLNHWGDRPGWCMHGYEVEKLIADAPTIVPAEGGKADDN